MQFKDLKLNKPILKAISEKKYEIPTPIQEYTIPLILDRKDVIASAQTGTGKTAAFALPILQLLYDKQNEGKAGKKTRALIISPTRELAIQIAKAKRCFTSKPEIALTDKTTPKAIYGTNI